MLDIVTEHTTPGKGSLIISRYPELFAGSPFTSAIQFGIQLDGAGWLGLLDGLCQKLRPLALEARTQGLQFKILGVKRKFGTLRIAYREGNEEIDEVIERAKSEALRTCEQCGQLGELSSHQNYLMVQCESCNLKYIESLSS